MRGKEGSLKTEGKSVKKYRKKYRKKGKGQLILRPGEEKPSGLALHLRAAGFHINLSC